MNEYKFCKICQEEKLVEEFSYNKNTKDKKYPYCKSCKSLYSKKHYIDNKSRYLKNATERYKKLKDL